MYSHFLKCGKGTEGLSDERAWLFLGAGEAWPAWEAPPLPRPRPVRPIPFHLKNSGWWEQNVPCRQP